jgi:predicted enzyme related to lactoylglutathione lyase
MIVKAPEKIPAPPTPAIARPTMRATEVGARAQISEPTNNQISIFGREIDFQRLRLR